MAATTGLGVANIYYNQPMLGLIEASMPGGLTALVPYYRPGDPAVAGAIEGLAGKYSSVLLANHGPVVSGDTLEAAVFAIEELEETAKLYLLLRNLNPRYLTPGQVRDLTKTFGLMLPEHRH